PSKNAIVEAICQRCLAELEDKAWAVARARSPAAARMERLVLEILAYHKENLLVDQRVHDIVQVAIEQSWEAIEAHKETIRTVAELILRDGVEAGEFEPIDVRHVSAIMMRALVTVMHPVMVAECVHGGEDLEAEAHATVQFLLRAITPKP